MREISDLVYYLHNYFAPEIWKPASNYIGNFILSELTHAVESAGGPVRGLKNRSFNFDRSFGVIEGNNNTIELHFPYTPDFFPRVTLRHSLSGTIELAWWIRDIDFSLNISSKIIVSSDDPNFIGTVLSRGDISGHVEIDIDDLTKGNTLGLSGLQTVRFDNRMPIQWNPKSEHLIEPANPNLSTNTFNYLGFVDLLFVPDGFRLDELREFDAFIEHVVAHPLIKPFLNFKSVIRLWKASMYVEDADDKLQRSTTSFDDGTGPKMNFSNLARVAEIGIQAEQTLGRHPITVYVSKNLNNSRSVAQGPYILLAYDFDKNEDAVQTLIHELGHTPLGNYLADEYPSKPGRECDFPKGEKIYKGLEPYAKNISTSPRHYFYKWLPFLSSLDLSEGAFEHDKQIYRFQKECRMRCSKQGEFCPICLNELTSGILDLTHYSVGDTDSKGMMILEVKYREPWQETRIVQVKGSAEEVLKFSPYRKTSLTLKVISSTIPLPWRTNWQILNNANGNSEVEEISSDEIRLNISKNDQVSLTLDHDTSISSLLSNLDPTINTTISFRFTNVRFPSGSDLRPPTNLKQTELDNFKILPNIDQETGRVSLDPNLWLEGTIQGFQFYDLLTSIEFKLKNQNGFIKEHRSDKKSKDSIYRWNFRSIIPSGCYTWEARAFWHEPNYNQTLISGWKQGPINSLNKSFEVLPLSFSEERVPPKKPFPPFGSTFGWYVLNDLSGAGIPLMYITGMRVSSWHPNGLAIKFEYEFVEKTQEFLEQNIFNTEFFTRNLENYSTVAIIGELTLPNEPGHYKWRVRAIDEDELFSDWVTGDIFITDVDRAIEEWWRVEQQLNEIESEIRLNGWFESILAEKLVDKVVANLEVLDVSLVINQPRVRNLINRILGDGDPII